MFNKSKSIASIIQRAGRLSALPAARVWGIVCAIATPLLIALVGNIIHVLIEARSPEPVHFAGWLPELASWIPNAPTPLAKVTIMVAMLLMLVLAIATAMYLFNLQIQAAAVQFEVNLIRSLQTHSKRLAIARTLSAQENSLVDSLEYHLPRIRTNLSRWWRSSPRHIVQGVGCVLIVFLIQPLLAALVLVGACLGYFIFSLAEKKLRGGLPLVRERATQNRNELVRLAIKGPLLALVQGESDVEASFDQQLQLYKTNAEKSLSNSAWKMPLLIAVAGLLGSVFIFVASVQILRPQSQFSIAGAVTFWAALGVAGLSAFRLQRSARDLRQVASAAEELEHFLSLQVDVLPTIDQKRIDMVRQKAELDHVTLRDCSGRKLLENLSTVLMPNELVGVVASDRLQAQALVELLLGYGRPTSGRVLIDDVLVTDLTSDSLSRCAHWVGPDGPLFTGSVTENLLRRGEANGAADLHPTLAEAEVLEAVQRLPDGVATLITAGDDRLPIDAAFRLGIARARLRRPSIIVLDEPAQQVDQSTEQVTLRALRGLVSPQSITVILPSRLTTVRACDRILFIHDHSLVDSGTHSDLLQRSELYRHINYMRFNPFGTNGN